MRRLPLAPVLLCLAVAPLAAPPAVAQSRERAAEAPAVDADVDDADELANDVDREEGEEEEIREREEWFVNSRGLKDVARPDLLRADAVRELAVRRAARSAELRAGSQVWQNVGPTSMTMLSWAMGPVAGRVVSLAVHPTDETINYIGTASGGLWKTVDNGSTWTSIFDEIGTLSVGAVVLDPANPDVVWAGTGERQNSCTAQGGGQTYFGLGLFRSPDGGLTFEARNGTAPNTLDLSYIQGIAVHPSSPDTLLVAGEAFCLPDGTRVGGGVFKTTDGGLNWTRVRTGAGSDVFYHPANPSIAYVAMNNNEGVLKSLDGGDTWTLTPGIAASPRMRLAMAGSDPQTLYAYGSNGQLYKTVNGAGSWALMASGVCTGQCTYNLHLDIDPTDPAHILIAEIRPWESADSGVNRSVLTTTWGSGQTVHQDIHVVRFSRQNPLRYWIAGDGGIWRTDTAGFNYVNLNWTLILTQFYDVAVDPGQPGRIFGGAQDNSSSARFGANQWNVTVVTGDGFMNAIDPVTLTRVFQTSYPASGTPSVYRSTSSGNPNTFARLATFGITAGEPFPWVTPMVAMQDQVFVASHSVYRGNSTQATNSFNWTKISPMIGNGSAASVITLHPPKTVPYPGIDTGWGAYVGTSGGSIGRGVGVNEQFPGWKDVTGNYPGGYVSDIAVDPVDSDRVYATRGAFNLSRLYRSTTGGFTWTAVGAGLPNVPANAVAVDPSDPRRVFVGTDIGVYESQDYGATFLPFMEGMPLGTVVTDLEVDDAPYYLLAGTYGRGALRVDLVAVPAAPTAPSAAEPARERAKPALRTRYR
jgi:photosystem II stability/assembly factor-like uncharacterized protein